MLRFFILLTFIPAIILANTNGIKNCAGNPPLPIETSVRSCSQTPCDIKLGERTGIDIIFKAPRDISTFKPKARAHVLGIGIDHDLPEDIVNGACDNLSAGECPIPEGTVVEYNFELLVSSSYPPTKNIDVDISLLDQDDKVIVCSRITINAIR
uniref:Putative niemann-pick type c2 n=2 Tax=Nyssomyia neivai TaxID=330878 RepID=A0A1L8DQ67_9DIPT